MSKSGHCRPRTTYAMKERVETLALELADDDTTIRGFHDAVTVLVETLECENE